MTQPTIQERRDRAASALHYYVLHAKRTHPCEAAELLCDLMHWLDAEDLDIDDKIYQARRLYEQEVQTAEDAARNEAEALKDALMEVVTDRQLDDVQRILEEKRKDARSSPQEPKSEEERPKHYSTLTGEEARAWLIKNDSEGAALWSSPDLSANDLIEAVGDNLRDFGDFGALTASEVALHATASRQQTRTVVVNFARLRAILDYLHGSEADHYDPETYPEDVNDHVYAHVMAIEEELKARAERGAQ